MISLYQCKAVNIDVDTLDDVGARLEVKMKTEFRIRGMFTKVDCSYLGETLVKWIRLVCILGLNGKNR
jgi:hypothetical protein